MVHKTCSPLIDLYDDLNEAAGGGLMMTIVDRPNVNGVQVNFTAGIGLLYGEVVVLDRAEMETAFVDVVLPQLLDAVGKLWKARRGL